MKNITQLMNNYRECIRHLWNTYFLQKVALENENQWDTYDEYERICALIFSSLVLSPIDKQEFKKSFSYDKNQEPLLFLHVIPSSEAGSPILVNRDIVPSGYWDHPVNFIKRQDVDLRFIDLFDFDLLNFRDFRYYKVRIIGSNDQSLIGRDALIETSYVKLETD